MIRSVFNCSVACVLVAAFAAVARADHQAFLAANCLDCHSKETREGGLDLSGLAYDLQSPGVFARWERIHDRVESGEMPPPSAGKLSAAAKASFLQPLAKDLSAAHAASKGTTLRRLNRREYQNTLNDLFGTNLKLADRLPEDRRAGEFDNVGEALGISQVQLQRYLECFTAVLDESIAKSPLPPAQRVVKASYSKTQGAEQWLGKIWLERDDGAVVFFKQFGYPSGMLREANVSVDGYYKVRVTGYAYQSDVPVTFALGATTFARGVEMPTFGYFALPPGKPTTIEIKAWIPARYMIEITPYGITDQNNEIRQKGIDGYQGPGLAIQSVEIEGPLVNQFPSVGQRLLFDGFDREEILPRNPRDRERPNYVAKFEIKSESPSRDVLPVLKRVATKAFRRPVTDADVQPYLQLFDDEMKRGAKIEEALRTSVTAIFCSVDFLYLRESPGWLDDYALATRLAYFLNRSAPDEELLKLAAAGQLAKNREVLEAQIDRLLAKPESTRFVTDFTDAWLNLRDLEFTNPDGALFPEYDALLLYSMEQETRQFFRALIDENLPVTNVVKSDFAILNSRLAEHYGIAGVDGPELRKVKLPADSVRGGFLSQASVLKVSANGTNTSPVVRGVFVAERILGAEVPPPPPGVPGVDPDIRGATTLRELLDKHRTADNCRGCHRSIDPPGFALESFDPIGGWRDRFRALGGGEKVQTMVRGQRVRYSLGPAVDAAGELPDGDKFAGYLEFRDLLARDDQKLAKALAIKLLTFGTGRELGFSDRAEVDRIVAASAESRYGVRDLLKQVVTSSIFRQK